MYFELENQLLTAKTNKMLQTLSVVGRKLIELFVCTVRSGIVKLSVKIASHSLEILDKFDFLLESSSRTMQPKYDR